MHTWWRIIFLISTLYYGVKSKPGRALIEIEKHPYVVSIQEQNQHKCNGIILTRRFILTSGHCLDNHLNSYSVLAGADDLSAPFQANRAKVLHFLGHEEIEYDMGLMQLSEPLNFTESIQPIRMPKSLERVPSQGYLVGFGNYRVSKFKDRLRALRVVKNETSAACDQDSEMEFCISQYTGPDTETLPDEDVSKRSPEPSPQWVDKDKQDPFEWPTGKKEGANRRSMWRLEKDMALLEDMGSGVMNEFTLGTPYVRNGVVYGVLSKKDGETGVMTAVPLFVKYLRSNIFDFSELNAIVAPQTEEPRI